MKVAVWRDLPGDGHTRAMWHLTACINYNKVLRGIQELQLAERAAFTYLQQGIPFIENPFSAELTDR